MIIRICNPAVPIEPTPTSPATSTPRVAPRTARPPGQKKSKQIIHLRLNIERDGQGLCEAPRCLLLATASACKEPLELCHLRPKDQPHQGRSKKGRPASETLWSPFCMPHWDAANRCVLPIRHDLPPGEYLRGQQRLSPDHELALGDLRRHATRAASNENLRATPPNGRLPRRMASIATLLTSQAVPTLTGICALVFCLRRKTLGSPQ